MVHGFDDTINYHDIIADCLRTNTIQSDMKELIYGVGSSERVPVLIYSSDFSAGVDNWQWYSQNSVMTGNVDGISDGVTSYDDCLRNVKDTDQKIVAGMNSNQTVHGDLTGLSFNLKAKVYVPSGLTATGFHIYKGSTPIYDGKDEAGTWIDIDEDVAGVAGTVLVFQSTNSAWGDGLEISMENNADTATIYIKDVVITGDFLPS